MNDFILTLLINGGVVLCIIGLWAYARYWRRKAAKAFLQHAVACYKKEDREELARQAIMAGSRHAGLLYALTCPERFDIVRPMRAFRFGKIRCVCAGYYFPQRYESWLRDDQADFVQDVYAFKDGEEPCEDYFSQAFEILSVNENVTAVFMPCSTSERYYRRFAKIARYLERHGYAMSGLHLIGIIRNRESKHTAAQRSSVDTSNYSMSLALQGKKVVIVDDLLTTGSSLTGFARNLERIGAEVIGAVFLARTFQVPSWTKVRWTVWKRHVLPQWIKA
ncbi:phosphoribosyltransferase [Bacteroides sp. An269]|uniref:phosphoribosyltransferase n=1 Tax=Bacteroides sp. An269 TaxID=1965613 RepID=UPI000B396641|nr:phosphoribosyltransferase [Bacteroides sp. An269]OUO70690.1 phosphoribosyltransferase [Bacteroides sp. An269]